MIFPYIWFCHPWSIHECAIHGSYYKCSGHSVNENEEIKSKCYNKQGVFATAISFSFAKWFKWYLRRCLCKSQSSTHTYNNESTLSPYYRFHCRLQTAEVISAWLVILSNGFDAFDITEKINLIRVQRKHVMQKGAKGTLCWCCEQHCGHFHYSLHTIITCHNSCKATKVSYILMRSETVINAYNNRIFFSWFKLCLY